MFFATEYGKSSKDFSFGVCSDQTLKMSENFSSFRGSRWRLPIVGPSTRFRNKFRFEDWIFLVGNVRRLHLGSRQSLDHGLERRRHFRPLSGCLEIPETDMEAGPSLAIDSSSARAMVREGGDGVSADMRRLRADRLCPRCK